MSEAYAQLVVSLPWHDKLLDIEDELDRVAAFGLYAAACCFCQDNLTDGRIRKAELARVFPSSHSQRLAVVLAEVRLFDREGSAYFVHDYLDFNRSREQIEQLSEQKRAAGRAGGKASATARAQASATARAQAESNPTTATTTSSTRARPCLSTLVDNLPESVVGVFADKMGRQPTDSEALSLKSLCKSYPEGVVTLAIGQAVARGHAADDFGFITKVARDEVAGVAS